MRRQGRTGPSNVNQLQNWTFAINWTAVMSILAVFTVVTLLAPLVWRVTVQLDESETKFAGLTLLILLVVCATVGMIVAVVAVFANLTRRAIEQDDADEARKQAALMQAMFRTMEQAFKTEKASQTLSDAKTPAADAWVQQMGNMSFTDTVDDVELG